MAWVVRAAGSPGAQWRSLGRKVPPTLRLTASGRRHDGGDDLPAVLAIDARVALQRHHDPLRLLLGHAHQARHRPARSAPRHGAREARRADSPLLRCERGWQSPLLEQIDHGLRAVGKGSHQKAGLGDHGLTGKQRRFRLCKAGARPGVGVVASIEQGNQRPGVRDYRRPQSP